MMKTVGFFLLILNLVSCASTTTNRAGLNIMSESAYENVIDKWSDNIENYNGLSNTMSIKATLLNNEAALAQLDQNARLFQWDQITFDNEKKNLETRLGQRTEVFVSFYSPERKWDDLYKSKTLWKIFLDVDGMRFEGKATKIKLLPREIQGLYHYHTSFATPYTVTFPVPANTLDGKTVRLIFTGSVGSAALNFGR